jgi:hypothetical protein
MAHPGGLVPDFPHVWLSHLRSAPDRIVGTIIGTGTAPQHSHPMDEVKERLGKIAVSLSGGCMIAFSAP